MLLGSVLGLFWVCYNRPRAGHDRADQKADQESRPQYNKQTLKVGSSITKRPVNHDTAFTNQCLALSDLLLTNKNADQSELTFTAQFVTWKYIEKKSKSWKSMTRRKVPFDLLYFGVFLFFLTMNGELFNMKLCCYR